MKGFKEGSVFGSMYLIQAGSKVMLSHVKQSITGQAEFVDKIYALATVNKTNESFGNRRQFIVINLEKTAEAQIGAGNMGWKDMLLLEKQKQARRLKRAIKFPASESYTLAIEDGEELKKTNDYLIILEKEIEEIKALKFEAPVVIEKVEPPVVEEVLFNGASLEKVKLIIKNEELGLRAHKDDTAETLMGKVVIARAKLAEAPEGTK